MRRYQMRRVDEKSKPVVNSASMQIPVSFSQTRFFLTGGKFFQIKLFNQKKKKKLQGQSTVLFFPRQLLYFLLSFFCFPFFSFVLFEIPPPQKKTRIYRANEITLPTGGICRLVLFDTIIHVLDSVVLLYIHAYVLLFFFGT